MAKETIGTEITKKAFEYIDAIASNLGVATEYVFTILVRQQLAEGIAWLVMSLIILVGGWFAVRFLFRTTADKVAEIKKKSRSAWYTTEISEDVIVGLRWIVLSAYVIAILIVMFNLPQYVTKVVNPEYYAIKEVLDAFTGGKSE